MLGDFANRVAVTLPNWIKTAEVTPSHEVSFTLSSPDHVVPFLTYLRDNANMQFKMLIDLTAVDFPSREKRFEVVYNFLSPRYNARVRVKVETDEFTAVPTCVPLFPNANWYEREVWDMYGIRFTGHPDLRRILTDYGFQGHPLRKDFPLSGYLEVRYDDTEKRVIYEPLELSQAFRAFDFASPWEANSALSREEVELPPPGTPAPPPPAAPAAPGAGAPPPK